MRAWITPAVQFIAILPLALALTAVAAPATTGEQHANVRKLMADAKCEKCHATKVGGDGTDIYSRKERRVTTRNKLLPQVERCNSELSLGLFPEDEVAIAAYLNATHYKFKD